MQAAKAALSSLQRNNTPASLSLNPKEALAVLTSPVGPELIAGAGGSTVSSVNAADAA